MPTPRSHLTALVFFSAVLLAINNIDNATWSSECSAASCRNTEKMSSCRSILIRDNENNFYRESVTPDALRFFHERVNFIHGYTRIKRQISFNHTFPCRSPSTENADKLHSPIGTPLCAARPRCREFESTAGKTTATTAAAKNFKFQ